MNQNLPQATGSQTSQIQLQKPKPFLEYTKTKEEHDIALCLQNSVMIGRLQDPNELLKVITEWRIYIGVPKSEDLAEEFTILAKFLHENYAFLTIDEIRLAYTLSVTRKLKEVEFYGYFSPMYVGKVLDSYLYYRKITMADALREREKHQQELKEQANRPTPEQMAKDMKELIKGFYAEWKENGEIKDVFSISYNFLRKHNMLIVKKEEIDEAMAYGLKMARSKEKKVFEKVNPEDEKLETQRYARNWCVHKYFETINIDVLLNNINSELFT
jgi:hypothetical protein